MSRRKIAGLLVLGFIIVATSAFCVRVLSQAGQFTTVKKLRTGMCQQYAGIMAPEDIAIDHKTQTAFISSLDRTLMNSSGAGSSSLRGAIKMIDLAAIKPGSAISYKDVTPPQPEIFHPRGLSLFTGADNIKRLFVINQTNGSNHRVEIFRLTSDKLIHEKSVELGAEIIFASDVLAVGPDRFYVTSSASPGVVSSALNFSLQRKNSKVLYYDGKKISQAASGFVMANGIGISKSGEDVYVLDTYARSLRFFARNKETGILNGNGVLFIGTGVDKIDIAQDGSLWMAAHPKLIDFAMYRAGMKAVSSSQVIHAVPAKKGGGNVRTLFLDLGNELSGSSVAAAYGNKYIIGSARDNKLMICDRK